MGFADKLKKEQQEQDEVKSSGNSSFLDKVGKKKGSTSFVDQMIASNGNLIFYVKGKDATNGLDAVYFVMVDQQKIDMFKKIVERGEDMNLLDYGQIVSSCYGTEPNDRVKKLMKEKYDFDV